MIKKKSLFDHINQITSVQNPNYWNEISDEDKKTWSNYMTHRFLSMKSDWIELVNELQKYNLSPNVLYKLYTNVLPKKKQWLRYIKGKKDIQYEKWVLEIVAKHYQVSISEAIGYLDVYMMSEGGKIELVEILNKYGTDPKLIKKLKL
jgi:hypothetical protein